MTIDAPSELLGVAMSLLGVVMSLLLGVAMSLLGVVMSLY